MATNPEVTQLGSPQFWDRLKNDPSLMASEVCQIDLVDMEKTLQQHAGLRAWINAAHESARVAEERAKWEVTKAEARALLEAKDTPDPKTGKPKTVDVIKAEAAIHPLVTTATEEYLAASEKRGALRAMSSALEDRKDMLVQLAAKRRQEQGDYRG